MALKCLSCMLFIPIVQAQDQHAMDTVEYILKSKKDVEEVSIILKDVANYYLNKNDTKNASFVRDKLMKYAREHNYLPGIDDALGVSGSIAIKEKDVSKARAISKEWLQDAKRNKNDYGANGAYFLWLRILYHEGKMDSVIIISNTVLESNQATYDSIYFPRFHAMAGNVYLFQGDFQKANDHYLKALHIAELTGNELTQSVCIGNLGIINKELRNERGAMKYYKRALELRIKNNLLHDVAGTYVSLATCYQNLQINDSAALLFTQALDLFKKLDSKPNIALVNNNLGQLLIDMNQTEKGMEYMQLAKDYYTSANDSMNLANNAWAIGNAWFDIYKQEKNISYLQKGLSEMLVSKSLAEKLGMESLKMSCYKSLSDMYEAIQNEGAAFHYLKLYNLISDSIRSNDYTRQIAEMQTKYDSDQKANEIAKLNAENLLGEEKIARQRVTNYSLLSMAGLILLSGVVVFRNVQKKRKAEKQIATLEKQNAIESMRSKIASDVHDEIGANLTRLGLNAQQLLQSPVMPEAEKHLAEKMSHQSKEIITGMREIIWASNPANDNLKSMLGFMRQYIDRFFDGTNIRPVVNFPHDVGEITLHPEVRRNLFLILKESLNNTVKYSDSDRVDIDFQTENEKFEFRVKDYGKGLDDKTKDDFSNGMRNMKMRAEQIQSLFRLISAPGQGVQIIVEGKLY